jgi:hypothetical protein
LSIEARKNIYKKARPVPNCYVLNLIITHTLSHTLFPFTHLYLPLLHDINNMKAASVLVAGLAALAQAMPGRDRDDKDYHKKHEFTSSYTVLAVPSEVVDANNTYTGGLEGACGVYRFHIDSGRNTICYDITLLGFRGEYQSPAKTATHIHEARRGKAGPPRLAFPNPVGKKGGPRVSKGCLKGPFKTGVLAAGIDTGDGFHVSEIEHDPSAFFADVHSSLAVAGAVRGQLG